METSIPAIGIMAKKMETIILQGLRFSLLGIGTNGHRYNGEPNGKEREK